MAQDHCSHQFPLRPTVHHTNEHQPAAAPHGGQHQSVDSVNLGLGCKYFCPNKLQLSSAVTSKNNSSISSLFRTVESMRIHLYSLRLSELSYTDIQDIFLSYLAQFLPSHPSLNFKTGLSLQMLVWSSSLPLWTTHILTSTNTRFQLWPALFERIVSFSQKEDWEGGRWLTLPRCSSSWLSSSGWSKAWWSTPSLPVLWPGGKLSAGERTVTTGPGLS